MTARWHAALAWALTGVELALPEPGRPDVAALVDDLARSGWPVERIAEHARAEARAERAWPHPVPAGLRAGCGAAQLAAALGAARSTLGLTALETRAPSTRRTLNADEQRLMREVPPHHVG
ncbi:MAG: hypothetical protein QM779_09470 [Propionicimonas sp.]|uniref:hypothetical protein n=1 Tax=Propionicimonas sp. TaxID=1955623 RepID=UPI003D0ABCC5